MKLQTAAHSLVVHQDKSVTEIAHEYGFSSSATFARSFKQFFGVSAEEYRVLTASRVSDSHQPLSHPPKGVKLMVINQQTIDNLQVIVKKISSFNGIFVNSKLDDSNSIQKAFSKILQLAENNDLLTENSKFIGVVYPHHNLYRAVVTIEPNQIVPPKLEKIEFSAGKFATLKTCGDFEKTFETLVIFSKIWLKENGYKIADTFYFEMFAENPVGKNYETLEKETYNPITPVN
jgi:AraC family transcriptional regulator